MMFYIIGLIFSIVSSIGYLRFRKDIEKEQRISMIMFLGFLSWLGVFFTLVAAMISFMNYLDDANKWRG